MAKIESFGDVAPIDLDGSSYLYVRRPGAATRDTKLAFANFIKSLWAATDNASARSGLGMITVTSNLDFPSIAAQAKSDLTIAVAGAAVGDAVFLGLPAAPAAGLVFNAFVSAANVVTVRASNTSSGAVDAAVAAYRVVVFKTV